MPRSSRNDAPVGRRAEFERIVEYLTRDTSAVVLITGPPASGRSHLVRAVGDAARAAGFRVAGVDGSLALTDASTVAEIRTSLERLLAHSHEHREPDTDDPADDESLLRSGVNAVMGFLGREPDEERAIARLLADVGRTLVVIDGFTPPQPVRWWVSSRLVRDVRSTDAPVVLVISGSPDDIEPLRGIADDTVELGELDGDDVREHLRALAHGLSPSLGDDELTAYVDASVAHPSVLRDLTTVFDLLTPSER